MKKSFTFFLFCFLFFVSYCFSQQNIVDSLQQILLNSKDDSSKITTLNILSEKFLKASNYEKALGSANEALILSEKTNSLKGKSKSLSNIGNAHLHTGNYAEALENYLLSLKIQEGISDKAAMATSLNNIGLVYYYQGNHSKSLEFHLQSLKINEELGDSPDEAIAKSGKNGIAKSYNNIGVLYRNQNNYEKALEYYQKCLEIWEVVGDKKGMATSLNNIGGVYVNQGSIALTKEEAEESYRKSLECHFKSLKIKEETGDKRGIALSMDNIGIVYQFQKNFPKALEFSLPSLKIREEIGDKDGIALSMNNVGLIYAQLGKYDEALKYFNKGLKVAGEIGAKTRIRGSYEGLSETNEKIGNFRKALEYYKKFIETRDSIFNEENTKNLVRSEMNFEFEKKQGIEKAEQEKKDFAAKEERQRQMVIRNSFIGGFVLVLILITVILKGYRQKQRANMQLKEKNYVIEEQKKIVEEKNKDITDSINYAKRIQEAMLPQDDLIKKLFPDSFILFKPKAIVSGDFYWFTEKNDKKLISAVDCTGHGVPGAFMSMIGNTFLNEIVNEKGITRPDKILYCLREGIIKSLKQKGEVGENKDGMDIALCMVEDNTLSFAGANNPLWVVSEGKLSEIKGDNQPIGIHLGITSPFLLHSVDLQKGDCFYIFTDGYADQFGGPKGKKFKYSQFKKLLVSIHDKPMIEQKEILEKSLEEWRGNLEQVDDICVIGILV